MGRMILLPQVGTSRVHRSSEYEGRLGRAEVESRSSSRSASRSSRKRGSARTRSAPAEVHRRADGRPELRGALRRCYQGVADFGDPPRADCAAGRSDSSSDSTPKRNTIEDQPGIEVVIADAVVLPHGRADSNDGEAGPSRACRGRTSPTETRSVRGFTPHARTSRYPRHEMPPRWGPPGGTLARYHLIRSRFQTRAGSARTSSGRVAITEPS